MKKDRVVELKKFSKNKQIGAVTIKTMKFVDAAKSAGEGLNFYEVALIVVYLSTLIFLLIGYF
jgi:hypothetical protein